MKSARQPTTRPDGPNMILLLAGDLAPGMTGFEGNAEVKTPNLDRLAADGARFTRCYAPTPQSAPARATVLTGQYPHTHGVTADGVALKHDADTFTARLQKAGYACGYVGEWDLPAEKAKEPGFGLTDYVATDNGQWTKAETWVNGKQSVTQDYLTDWQADRAVECLEQFKDRPFFLCVSFRAPGEPLEYPPKMEGRSPSDALKLPKTVAVDKNGWPNKLKTAPPPAAGRFEQKKADEQALRLDRSKYAATIARLDENLGRILERLDALGLRKNTVVVFASCNGLALGDHALYGKGPMFYEELVRGPLLVRYPGFAERGVKIERVVGLADLAPTFLQWAGQRKSFEMQGESLVPLLKNAADTRRGDEEFFEYERQAPERRPGQTSGPDYPCPARGLVTRNYKYVDYLDGSFVFYDLKRDPDEMQNLSAKLQSDRIYQRNYNPILQVLKDRLNRWRKQTRDPSAR